MAFNFRFEKVLDLKKRIEEKLKSELASLELKRGAVLSEREKLARELEDLRNEFSRRQEEGMSGGEIRLYLSFLSSLSVLIARKEEEIKHLEKKISEKREEIIEASKERKKFEKLRERAFEAYRYEEALRERRFLDEMGLNLFIRRERGGA
ncbi:MAG: flagellar export protein FliJ [Synergistetes bacterium]|nr:flagellar export protein FliJ [Synergistota bacterium]